MQTFMPFESYSLSAAVLDDKRLGKQRVETLQIMSTLCRNNSKGWNNHPAVNMWRGYEYSLLYYQEAICREWHLDRGFEDTCLRKTGEIFWDTHTIDEEDVAIKPWWIGESSVHLSHQSNLVRKDRHYYSKIFPDAPDNLDYVWPILDSREKLSLV